MYNKLSIIYAANSSFYIILQSYWINNTLLRIKASTIISDNKVRDTFFLRLNM